MRRRVALLAIAAYLAAASAAAAPATLILRNADIWTVDDARPTARALAIEGNRIVAVGDERQVMRLKGPDTRIMDLQGAFVLPGLIDAHTHFGNAIGAFFEVRLLDVNDDATLLTRLQVATHDVPKGMWITGYGWSAFAAAAANKKGDASFAPLTPSLAAIDRLTPDHPVLLRRYDGEYFINSRGLQLARIEKNTPDPSNGEYVRDPHSGELTGMLLGTAGERMAEILPPPSRARELIAARAMLRELNSNGFTSIHDIARIDEISQTKLYRTDVERSATDLGIFTDLRERGELTGDKAQQLLLDWYEDAIRVNPARDRRFRLIHAWYPAAAEVERAGKIGAIADIQPHHLVRELGDIEKQLGPERARCAFPWRTMIERGVRISLGSDWPGSFDRSSVEPLSAMENIYYAVTRQRLDGTPAGGFHPEQALTVDEAIRAYTINPAYGSREEGLKGSITVGKLADVVVLSRNIRKIPPREIPSTRVLHTIFDGRLVYSIAESLPAR